VLASKIIFINKNRIMGTPLTEERFLEFVKVFDTRMSGLESRMSNIEKEVKEIKGFQKLEANAIEYELYMLLKTHLRKTHPFLVVNEFPMKRLHDPTTDIEITELDSSFLLTPIKIVPDHSRLIEAGITISPPVAVSATHESIFVMAEAKHHLTRNKVMEKLAQFERIRHMFKVASSLGKDASHSYTKKFVETVNKHSFLSSIHKSILYFGAAYWEIGLLQELQHDVEKYKNYKKHFNLSIHNERKGQLVKGANKLESKWNITLSTEQIDGVLAYVAFVVPSGHRFTIPIDKKDEFEPESLVAHIGGQTRKKRKTEP
jgi:hypothetical protein